MSVLALLVSITTCALSLRNRVLASVRKKERKEVLSMLQPPTTITQQSMERQRPVSSQGTFGARAPHNFSNANPNSTVNRNLHEHPYESGASGMNGAYAGQQFNMSNNAHGAGTGFGNPYGGAYGSPSV
jgi:hypothetical protein